MIKLTCDHKDCDFTEELSVARGIYGEGDNCSIQTDEHIKHPWQVVEQRLFCVEHGKKLQHEIDKAELKVRKELFRQAVK